MAKSMHSRKERHTCPYCGKTFSTGFKKHLDENPTCSPQHEAQLYPKHIRVDLDMLKEAVEALSHLGDLGVVRATKPPLDPEVVRDVFVPFWLAHILDHHNYIQHTLTLSLQDRRDIARTLKNIGVEASVRKALEDPQRRHALENLYMLHEKENKGSGDFMKRGITNFIR